MGGKWEGNGGEWGGGWREMGGKWGGNGREMGGEMGGKWGGNGGRNGREMGGKWEGNGGEWGGGMEGNGREMGGKWEGNGGEMGGKWGGMEGNGRKMGGKWGGNGGEMGGKWGEMGGGKREGNGREMGGKWRTMGGQWRRTEVAPAAALKEGLRPGGKLRGLREGPEVGVGTVEGEPLPAVHEGLLAVLQAQQHEEVHVRQLPLGRALDEALDGARAFPVPLRAGGVARALHGVGDAGEVQAEHGRAGLRRQPPQRRGLPPERRGERDRRRPDVEGVGREVRGRGAGHEAVEAARGAAEAEGVVDQQAHRGHEELIEDDDDGALGEAHVPRGVAGDAEPEPQQQHVDEGEAQPPAARGDGGGGGGAGHGGVMLPPSRRPLHGGNQKGSIDGTPKILTRLTSGPILMIKKSFRRQSS